MKTKIAKKSKITKKSKEIKIIEKIKKYKIQIVSGAVGLILGILISMFFHSSYNDILGNELSKYKSGKWLVKIDGDPIGDKYLEKRVELYKKYIAPDSAETDPILRDKMLRKLIDNYIVLSSARKAGIFSSRKAQDYLWIFLEEAMANYYLNFRVSMKGKKNIILSNAEMNDFYEKNKEMFDKKKISKDKAFEIIKSDIEGLNEDIGKKNEYVKRRIELGQMKKEKKIIINNDLLKK